MFLKKSTKFIFVSLLQSFKDINSQGVFYPYNLTLKGVHHIFNESLILNSCAYRKNLNRRQKPVLANVT